MKKPLADLSQLFCCHRNMKMYCSNADGAGCITYQPPVTSKWVSSAIISISFVRTRVTLGDVKNVFTKAKHVETALIRKPQVLKPALQAMVTCGS